MSRLLSRNYVIVSGGNATEVAQTVERLSIEGWQLQGGVCVTHVPLGQAPAHLVYSQAMIKESWLRE